MKDETPSKKRRIEVKVPLNAVLEYFDTALRPEEVVCRDLQYNRIIEFINTCVREVAGSSLYVCGSPGIGKSYIINKIVDNIRSKYDKKVKCLMLNALTYSRNQDVYVALNEALFHTTLSWKSAKSNIEDMIIARNSNRGAILLCIDEIDHLFTKERSLIYELFEWPYVSKTPIILIGVANSIDLVERSLPLLKIRSRRLYERLQMIERHPETYVFPSYSKEDLKEIVLQRIQIVKKETNLQNPLFQPGALEMCCRKVAEMGDARRLLDVCKSALRLVYRTGEILDEKQVTVADMSSILFQFFRSSQASHIDELPRMAQILLACLCRMVKERIECSNPKKSKTVTPAQLKDVFLKILKNVISASRPDASEYTQLLDQLIHNGYCKIVNLTNKKMMDRPILMVISVDQLMSEMDSNTELTTIMIKAKDYVI